MMSFVVNTPSICLHKIGSVINDVKKRYNVPIQQRACYRENSLQSNVKAYSHKAESERESKDNQRTSRKDQRKNISNKNAFQ